jgi:hypothetical protein
MEEFQVSTPIDAELIKDLDRRLMAGYHEITDSVKWYDIARPHLFAHIRGHLQQVAAQYAVLAATRDDERFSAYARRRKMELNDFREQLHIVPERVRGLFWLAKKLPSTANLVLSLLPGLGLVTGITTFSALVLAVIDACFCALIKIVPMAVALAVTVSLVNGFSRKRDFLLGDAPDGRVNPGAPRDGDNLYELESRLARAMGNRASGEFQLDVLGWFVLAAFFFVWDPIVKAFQNEHIVTHTVAAAVLGAFFAAVGLVVLMRSSRRRWAWRPEAAVAEPPRTVA